MAVNPNYTHAQKQQRLANALVPRIGDKCWWFDPEDDHRENPHCNPCQIAAIDGKHVVVRFDDDPPWGHGQTHRVLLDAVSNFSACDRALISKGETPVFETQPA